MDVSCDADRCVRFGSPNSDGLTGPVHCQTVRYSSSDVPATIQRQAPTIKTVQGAVDVCQFQCLDRVVNVLVAIWEKRSISVMCCSSCVPQEHCGRPCCVATTRARDLEGQKTVDVPQIQYTGAGSRRLFPSPRALKSGFLFARTQTTQCQSSTLTGSSTTQCLRFLSRSWKP